MVFNKKATALVISIPGQAKTSTPDIILSQALNIQITQGMDVSVHKTLDGSLFMSHFGKSPVYGKFTCVSAATSTEGCEPSSTSVSPVKSLKTLYDDYMSNSEQGDQVRMYQFTFQSVTYKGYIIQIQQVTTTKTPGIIFYDIVFVGERV